MFDTVLKYATTIYTAGKLIGWVYTTSISEAKKLERIERKRQLRQHVLEEHPGHPSECNDLVCSGFN